MEINSTSLVKLTSILKTNKNKRLFALKSAALNNRYIYGMGSDLSF